MCARTHVCVFNPCTLGRIARNQRVLSVTRSCQEGRHVHAFCDRVARPSDCLSFVQFASVNLTQSAQAHLCECREFRYLARSWEFSRYHLRFRKRVKRNGDNLCDTCTMSRSDPQRICEMPAEIFRATVHSVAKFLARLVSMILSARNRARNCIPEWESQIAKGRDGKIGARANITRRSFHRWMVRCVPDECRSRAALAVMPIELRLRSSFIQFLVNSCEFLIRQRRHSKIV